jgi:hypothetical protein
MSVTNATVAAGAVVGVVPPPLVVLEPPHALSNIASKTKNVVIVARPLILRILASFPFCPKIQQLNAYSFMIKVHTNEINARFPQIGALQGAKYGLSLMA